MTGFVGAERAVIDATCPVSSTLKHGNPAGWPAAVVTEGKPLPGARSCSGGAHGQVHVYRNSESFAEGLSQGQPDGHRVDATANGQQGGGQIGGICQARAPDGRK